MAAPQSARGDRLAPLFCAWVTGAVLAGLVLAVLAYELQLVRTGTVAPPYPMSIYQLMSTPGTSPVPHTQGAAGVDFSQVYTSATALRHGESAYRPTSRRFRDYWNRPPGYPPLMNWLAIPFTLLRYSSALLLYSALSFLGLIAASAFVLWKAGLRARIIPVAMTQASLYFLTPIGVTHLERGQFDLVVAAASVLCVGLVFMRSRSFGMAVLAGLLGALKWTSVAFLGCFSALGFLLGKDAKRWAFFAIPLAMALGTFPFWQGLTEYWKTIQVYEIEASPYGLTLQYLLPRPAARAAPIVLTLAVAGFAWWRLRRGASDQTALALVSAPFSMALMNLAVCFGTLSYEYHTVSLLGLIPGLVIWIERVDGVRGWIKRATCAAFGGFLVIAYRTYGVGTSLSPEGMTAVYAGFSVLFFALCIATTAAAGRVEMR
jgi:hypothetical protein